MDTLSFDAVQQDRDRYERLWEYSLESMSRWELLRPGGDYGDATSWTWCAPRGEGEIGRWLNEPGRRVDPVPGLLDAVRERLVLPEPEIRTSPPPGAERLPVGLPVWFWVEDDGDRSETATSGDTWVRLDAVPTSMSLDVEEPWADDGVRTTRSRRVDCGRAGTPFDPVRDDPWSESACSHTFTWAGAADVEVVVTWELTWEASSGVTGSLGEIERSAVIELQPVGLEAATH